MQTRRGQSIEDRSMEIIDQEIGQHQYGPTEWPIVRRVIHSTADFDFAGKNAILFKNDPVQAGIRALKKGCDIVVDVNGVAGLLNKQNLAEYGNRTVCRISDADIAQAAHGQGKTRSQVSMRASAKNIDGGVVAIGNAPTALSEVIAMARDGTVTPALIVGIPVGFVGAAESKQDLAGLDVPLITNTGRKGGSPAAAAIINALFKLARLAP